MTKLSVLNDDQIRKWIDSMGIDDPEHFYDYLKTLEQTEYWTFEKNSACYQQFSEIADALSGTLDNSPAKRSPVIKDRVGDFLTILAYRNISASFRLLALLHKIQPSLTVSLLKICKTNQVNNIQPEAMLFLSRMQILLKTECLKRIFGQKRRNEIKNLLNSVKG